MAGSKRSKAIIASLANQGCKIKETRKGWLVLLPNGETLTIHNTDSDHRAEMNTRSRVLRAELEWPFDRRK